MANWNQPALTDTYANFLQFLKDRDTDISQMFDQGTPTNIPTNAIGWKAANNRFEKWNGSAWAALASTYAINVATVGGFTAGNASGNVPVSNGTVNTNLNADMVDGANAGTAANQVLLLSGAGKILAAHIPDTTVTPSTYKSVTVTQDGRITGGTNPTTLSGYGITDAALIASPTFTGVPAAPTASPGTNTTQLATTAFVAALGALKADLASPTFTGTAVFALSRGNGSMASVYPTYTNGWALGYNQSNGGGEVNLLTQKGAGSSGGIRISAIDTAGALIRNLLTVTEAGVATFPGTVSGTQLISTIATGTSPLSVTSTTVNTNLNADMVDGIQGTDLAPLASPALTGVPTAPTAAGGTNTTQIATTAFVLLLLASPTFTGTPAAPTAALTTSTTQIATTDFVQKAVQNAASKYIAAGGTASAMTATLVPTPAAINAGFEANVRAVGVNTITNPTINFNSIATKTIVKGNNLALALGDIPAAGYVMQLVFDATIDRMILMNPYTQGRQTIYLPASAMEARSANGCATIAKTNGAANQPDIKYLAFDGAAKEYATFEVRMPKSWNRNTVTAAFAWRRASGTGAANVVWGIRAVAVSDNDTPAATFGSDATVTDDAKTTTVNFSISGETGACTIAGTPVAEDIVYVEVFRDGASGSDTLDAVDAWLSGVTIYYGTDAPSDA